nr:hypothetical protein [Tanacetum cinerariifolium]
MRIEQYFLMTDYSFWEVILNGDSAPPTKIVDGAAQIIGPITAEQRMLSPLWKLESQVSYKTGLGFDSQVFDLEELHSHEADNSVLTNLDNDRYKTGELYHAIPPPYTRTFMPFKPDLVFTDESNASESITTISDSKDEIEIEYAPKQREPSFVPPSEHVKTSRSLNYLIKDYDYYEKQMVHKHVWNSAMRVNHQNSVRMTHPHSNRNVVPTTVLTRSRLVSLNAARPVPTVVPQSTVKSLRPVKHVVNKAHSTVRRPINQRTTTRNSNFNKKVTTVKVNKVNAVQGTKGNAEKASINWGNPQQALKDKGVIDNGCFQTLKKSMEYMLHLEEILKVGSKRHMYNVDLKNVVPSGDLTCRFAKATLDESNLWHRRLGHINFKTMNKLVKGKATHSLLMKGIKKEFSVARTSQQNGVAERKNRTLIEVVRTMLADSLLAIPFWDKAKKDDKGKSHVDSPTEDRDLRAEFEEFSFNSSNRVNAVSAPVNAAGPNSTNSTNSFNTASPSVNVVSTNFGIAKKSSFVDPSKYPDDPDMPELEDIVYSDDEEDVGAEADLSNLETNILVSPIITTRVHKDHHVNQIIAYASFMGFMVYHMDVKSAFVYGTIEEEVYVCQPPGFEDPDYPDKVYKVVKALYGLHLAPKACQDKYVAEILRKFSFTDVKSASTPIEIEKPLLKDPDGEDVDVYIYRYLKGKPHLGSWYPRDSPFNLVAYSDSDYAGASLDRKSTAGGCQFIGCRLIYWQCKKQTVVATSSTEAEYVAVASCLLIEAQQISSESPLLGVNTPRCDMDSIELMELMVFMATATVKKVNDDVQLRALIDDKKVVVSEDIIRRDLHLDDADGHVRNVDNPSKFLMYPRFLQVVINNQVDDMTSRNTRYTSLALTQKVFANMRRVGKEEVEMPIASAPPSPTNALSPPPQDPTPSPHATPPQDQPSIPPASPQQEQPTITFESSMSLLTTLMETCATLLQKVDELEKDKHTQALEIL